MRVRYKLGVGGAKKLWTLLPGWMSYAWRGLGVLRLKGKNNDRNGG